METSGLSSRCGIGFSVDSEGRFHGAFGLLGPSRLDSPKMSQKMHQIHTWVYAGKLTAPDRPQRFTNYRAASLTCLAVTPREHFFARSLFGAVL